MSNYLTENSTQWLSYTIHNTYWIIHLHWWFSILQQFCHWNLILETVHHMKKNNLLHISHDLLLHVMSFHVSVKENRYYHDWTFNDMQNSSSNIFINTIFLQTSPIGITRYAGQILTFPTDSSHICGAGSSGDMRKTPAFGEVCVYFVFGLLPCVLYTAAFLFFHCIVSFFNN